MKQILLSAFGTFLLLTALTSNAQVNRTTNKTCIPYYNNYQRYSVGGGNSTFEIRNGVLWACGANTSGQLGIGNKVTQLTPVQVGSVTNWVCISAGVAFTMGVRADGTLWVWGDNSAGEGGNGSTSPSSQLTPTQVSSGTNWVSCSAGVASCFAIQANGTLWSWGQGINGVLGQGSTAQITTPTKVGSASNWVSISVSSSANAFAAGIQANGSLWTWGYNTNGQLGNGTTTQSTSPVRIPTATGGRWASVSCGTSHVLALQVNASGQNQLWAWGDNSQFELGDNTTTQRNSPVLVTSTSGTINYNWVQVSAGNVFSVGVTSSGRLYGWGLNSGGQYGTGNQTKFQVPKQISGQKWVYAIAQNGSGGYSIAMQADGTLWASGFNSTGNWGNHASGNNLNYVEISVPELQWLSVCTDDSAIHTIGLRSDGTLWAWGSNTQGQIGTGTPLTTRTTPVRIGISGILWKGIGIGVNTGYAIRSDGTLWAWGFNGSSQIGDGTAITRTTSVQVGTDTTWISVSGGYNFALGLRTDSSGYYAWGTNANGQLGGGAPLTTRTIPTRGSAGTYFSSIAAGGLHGLAIQANGSLWGWGYNGYGQVGNNSTTTQNTPVQIATDTSWVAITAGMSHSVGLLANDSIYSWGLNTNNRLGDGTTTQRNVPTAISGGNNMINIAAGGSYSLALRADGSLFDWGNNSNGQLGTSNTTTITVPTQVSGESNIVAIAAGAFHSGVIDATRNNICMTGLNSSGQLGNGTTTQSTSFGCVDNATSTTVGSLNASSFCAGDTMVIPFTINGTAAYNSGNTFSGFLYNAQSGKFYSMSPGLATNAAGTITTVVPQTAGGDPSTIYQVCVQGNSPINFFGSFNTAFNGTYFTIKQTPNIVAVNSPAAVCSPATINITDTVNVTPDNNHTTGTFSYYATLVDAADSTNQLVTPSAIATSGTYYFRDEDASGCKQIDSVAVVVDTTPVLVTIPVTGCIGATVDITGAGVITDTTNVPGTLSYYSDSIDAAASTNPLTTDSVMTISTSGTFFVQKISTNGSCMTVDSVLVTIHACISNYTWLGGTDTSWFTGSNWSPGIVPNGCSANVVIQSGTAFSPVISGDSVSVGNVSIDAGVTLTLRGQNMGVCGNWTGGTGSNAAVIGDGTVYLNSTAGPQTVSGNTQFNILQVNNSQGVSLQAGASVSISTGLHLQGGTLDVSAGTLHLLSTASNNNSYIDDFTGGFTGTLNGNVIADRYVPTIGFNQHFISSPVSTPGFSQLNANGPDGGYIRPLANCDEYQSDYGTPYGNVFQYNDGHAQSGECMMANWEVRSAGNLDNARGYSTYLTGNTTLSLTGTANTGYIKIDNLNNSGFPTVATLQGHPIESGWNLVGNPYPSAIDLTISRDTNGFQNQVQVWKTSGLFEGSWQSAMITGESGSVVIPPFQAFMVRIDSGSIGSHYYPFYESERTRTANLNFYRSATENSLELNLDYNGTSDVTRVQFNPNATNTFDNEYDANKPDGGQGRPTLYTSMNDNHWYSINTIPALTQTATVPVGLKPEVSGSMTITPQGIESFDPTTYIYLEDKQTNTWQNLRNGAYTFTTNSTDDQGRFILHFTPPVQILTGDASCSSSGIINITQPGNANWSYTITDNNNALISSGTLNEGNPLSVSVTSGVYSLTLQDNTGYTVMKNIQVGGSQPVTAAFAVSNNTSQPQDNIMFSSSTANASAYAWNFGDGSTATGQTVNHSYQTEGVYNATLNVISSTGCTSTTTQSITVTPRSTTGIGSITGEGKINIWSNENRVYVDFSKQSKVDAQIDIYDVLGQILSSEKFGKSTIYSKPIENLEAAYMIVRVKNDDQVITQKVFITNIK